MSDQNQKASGQLSQEELDELVASSDTGGRNPAPWAAKILLIVAVTWSLFQIWIASPIPFMVGWGVFNDTAARSIHLGFAMFLAFTCYPGERSIFQMVLALGSPILLGWLFLLFFILLPGLRLLLLFLFLTGLLVR